MNVKEITANSDKFTVKDMDDKVMTTQPQTIRCVRSEIDECDHLMRMESLYRHIMH